MRRFLVLSAMLLAAAVGCDAGKPGGSPAGWQYFPWTLLHHRPSTYMSMPAKDHTMELWSSLVRKSITLKLSIPRLGHGLHTRQQCQGGRADSTHPRLRSMSFTKASLSSSNLLPVLMLVTQVVNHPDFTITDAELAAHIDDSAAAPKLSLTIGGKPYRGEIKHDHEGHAHDHAH